MNNEDWAAIQRDIGNCKRELLYEIRDRRAELAEKLTELQDENFKELKNLQSELHELREDVEFLTILSGYKKYGPCSIETCKRKWFSKYAPDKCSECPDKIYCTSCVMKCDNCSNMVCEDHLVSCGQEHENYYGRATACRGYCKKCRTDSFKCAKMIEHPRQGLIKQEIKLHENVCPGLLSCQSYPYHDGNSKCKNCPLCFPVKKGEYYCSEHLENNFSSDENLPDSNER